MEVLHLANDYSGSAVYKNLCEALDKIKIKQTIYVAVRSESLIGKNFPNLTVKESKVVYRNILNNYTRVNYYAKIKRITHDIKQQIKIEHFQVIHAHTWYSDGAVAYRLSQEYNIPYVLTIRGTDYNIFFKYLVYLRKHGLRILKNALKIIFISPSYQHRVYSHVFLKNDQGNLLDRSLVIPNGIDEFWIDNVGKRKIVPNEKLQLLFIGRFTKGKNIVRLIHAVERIRASGIDCQLTLVGGGGNNHNKVIKIITNKSFITFLGKISEKEDLKRLFLRSDIFTMPSRAETFGLVYIEAISQGLPVIYTIDEGIYGYFDNNIGVAVKWNDVEDIARGIDKVRENYSTYNFDPIEIASNHNWRNIANQYLSIYKGL